MLELLLADARTPTGGFAHSGGLEAARATPGDVPAFAAARLRTVGRLDAATAARAADGEDPLALDAAWAARTPAPAVREVARRQGRALLRLGRALWPDALETYAATSATTPRPVVLGLLGRAGCLAPVTVARLALYDDAASVCGAAPKLHAIDALEATGWLHALGPLVEALAAQAADPRAPLPAPATPLLDLRAQAHHHDSRRLFAS
ncbi:urease accessory protein UreF [Conexibacter sp. SYSU D00693]|uniref:urease accessory protein UreF n=1 Tax=Conexibacter sp. SYSU D00693 TaxID=2812560 RepID=UPI00196B1684|nr:urease accessory UreF family protein [Conexibacter sp. SYSU D00693]